LCTQEIPKPSVWVIEIIRHQIFQYGFEFVEKHYILSLFVDEMSKVLIGDRAAQGGAKLKIIRY
jgi:hypothetical protein